MHPSPSFITAHRLARLIAWASAALLWMAMLFYADAPPNRRHIRKRYGALTLDAMARMVRHLVLIRAAHIARPRAGRRAFAPRGFTRRMQRSGLARSGAGSWLRKHLRCADPARRFTVLLNALRNLDALARTLLRRMGGKLTRLRPLIATRPPSERACDLAAPAVFASDSS